MKLLIYTVVVRYQAIILNFCLTLLQSENWLARVHNILIKRSGLGGLTSCQKMKVTTC